MHVKNVEASWIKSQKITTLKTKGTIIIYISIF